MRIKKKSIGENLKNTENELNTIKNMVYQTSDELRNMGIPDDESEKIAANMVTKSYVNSKNDVVSEVGPEKVHTAKFDRCVADVKEKGNVDNPYAVRQASLGSDAIKKSHQKKDEDEYVKTEDVDSGTGEDFGDIGPGGDIEAKADDYEKFQELLRDLDGYSKEIEGVDNEEPMNDLPFESVRPKMTKDELIESVKRNTSKKRKVIKTISVKNLRNE
jgi:hypothetical protein